jgi:hypothetical protein
MLRLLFRFKVEFCLDGIHIIDKVSKSKLIITDLGDIVLEPARSLVVLSDKPNSIMLGYSNEELNRFRLEEIVKELEAELCQL